ncbi:MAG: methylated-DNA--[protein]-cysteine S-methyltransferase [Solirubrobacterales bacterium]
MATTIETGTAWDVHESPLGPLTLVSAGGRLRRLLFPGGGEPPGERRRTPELAAAREQLEEYFAGGRERFELPLEPLGSASQSRVWERLREVPYGATISYGELAAAVGRPGEAREIGAVVGQTPLPILIPCHRVLGADGSLTGYGGGLARKRALLDLEALTLC